MHHANRSLRWLSVISLILALFLQGCTNKGDNDGNPAPSNGTNATGSELIGSGHELEPYEVLITYQETPERDIPLVEEKLNEYLKDRINATIKLNPIAKAEYKQKTELMMNGGEKMDLVFTASWLDFFSNVTKGAFLPLDQLLEKHGQGIVANLNPLYLESPRFEGKLYAIPTNKEITQSKAITLRKDLVDKYDIPIETLKKMEDMEPYFQLIKENEPDVIPFFLAGGLNTGDGIMYESRSNYRPVGPIAAKTGLIFYDYTITNNIQVKSVLDPEIYAINKAELEITRHYYEKGYINADAATNRVNDTDLGKLGKTWFHRTVWKPGTEVEFSNAVNNRYEYVSSVIDEPIITTDLTLGAMLSISRTSEDPERAMMVLNYLHTDPYVVNLIVHGVEDVHYTKVGENRIELIPDSGFGAGGAGWVVGNQMLNYLKPGQPNDLFENWIQYNDEAKRSPILGFVFDDRQVKNELAQLEAIADEYIAIRSGSVANPVKLLEERNKKFEAAGLGLVQAELQAQIARWEGTK